MVLISCSKDQKYVGWLGDGTWSQTSNTINGEENDLGGTLTLTQTYDECKVKDSDCTGSYEYTLVEDLGGIVTGGRTFLYRVHEKGTKITFTALTFIFNGNTQDCTVGCASTWDILEMEKDRHVLTTVDDSGNTWIRTFEKI